MERNVDKIKRLEHELGRWRKKVADTANENEKLREALENKRKEVKRECMAPYTDFEAKVKELVLSLIHI